MTVQKYLIRPERLRLVPEGFGWVDHRFVRDRFIADLSCEALALYLFLLTVADGDGISHWSEASIARILSLSTCAVKGARCELEGEELLAFAAPLWQVLALPKGGAK